MMRVKTLRDHRNEFGSVFEKKNGRVYDLPDDTAAVLIGEGLVEKHDDSKADRVSGAGKSTGGATKSDG